MTAMRSHLPTMQALRIDEECIKKVLLQKVENFLRCKSEEFSHFHATTITIITTHEAIVIPLLKL